MSEGSGAGVRRWYPRNLLRWSTGFSVLLVIGCLWGWFALDQSIRDQFTWPQVATLAFFALVMIAMMMGLGLCTVIADDTGLRVRNGVRITRLRWDQIAEIRYLHGDPWAYAIHDDGTDDPRRTMLMGIQTTDGERCVQAVADLREMLAARRG